MTLQTHLDLLLWGFDSSCSMCLTTTVRTCSRILVTNKWPDEWSSLVPRQRWADGSDRSTHLRRRINVHDSLSRRFFFCQAR